MTSSTGRGTFTQLPRPRLSEFVRKKLVVVGDGSCGKTCLLVSFSKDGFIGTFMPTVFEQHAKDIDIGDGRTVSLFLVDSSGQEDYESLRRGDYEAADVLVLCFSVDNKESFDNAAGPWADEIKAMCGEVPFLLVGNTTPLRESLSGTFSDDEQPAADDKETAQLAASCRLSKLRVISYAEGARAAEEIGAVGYFECHLDDAEMVKTVFREAARAAMDYSKNKQDGQRRPSMQSSATSNSLAEVDCCVVQ